MRFDGPQDKTIYEKLRARKSANEGAARAGRLNPINIKQCGYNDILCIKTELSYLRSSTITLQTHFKTLEDFGLTTGEQ